VEINADTGLFAKQNGGEVGLGMKLDVHGENGGEVRLLARFETARGDIAIVTSVDQVVMLVLVEDARLEAIRVLFRGREIRGNVPR